MKMSLKQTKWTVAVALTAAALAATALAQQPGATGGAVLASEPGKAAIVTTAELSAQVIGIDKATRTLTLKGPKGKVVDVVAGDEVKNFDQIKLGDLIVARYVEALTLELQKTKSAAGGPVVREEVAKAKPGERPAVAGGRQVTAIADVVAVDQKKSTITLKGPRGNVMELNVRNPDHFKVVKKGDQVEVVYTQALAMAFSPVAKDAGKKK
jgi:hypothetical protein